MPKFVNFIAYTRLIIPPPPCLWCLCHKLCSGTKVQIALVFFHRLYVLLFLVLFCSGRPRPSRTCWPSRPPRPTWSTRPPWKHRKRWTPWPSWRTSKAFVSELPLHDLFLSPTDQPVFRGDPHAGTPNI